MSKKNQIPEAAETVETVEAADVFPKESILKSKRFSHRRDALSFLLKDDKSYTFEQVETILNDYYMKGKVN